MVSKLILPTLSIVGLGFAVLSIAGASRPPAVAQPVAEPARTPYARFIAGAGIVEPSSRAVAVAAPLSRCVAEVVVRVGQEVARGEPLFVLDDRDLAAELAVRRTALATARARLERLLALPRAEDLPPARARVSEAWARLADAETQRALVEGVSDPRAVTRADVERRRHEVDAAAARLEQARAELASLEAGPWEPDLAVARAELAAAEAGARAVEVELARLTVRAPVDGAVLQVNVRPGEFAQAGPLDTPLIVMGALSPLHVRVDVDENDAWRFRAGTAASASVRGNRDISTELRFEYVEPYVVPKVSLTGDATERVDTRVMQVVFSFERGDLPIQVGQQMDVFISAGEGTDVEGPVSQ